MSSDVCGCNPGSLLVFDQQASRILLFPPRRVTVISLAIISSHVLNMEPSIIFRMVLLTGDAAKGFNLKVRQKSNVRLESESRSEDYSCHSHHFPVTPGSLKLWQECWSFLVCSFTRGCCEIWNSLFLHLHLLWWEWSVFVLWTKGSTLLQLEQSFHSSLVRLIVTTFCLCVCCGTCLWWYAFLVASSGLHTLTSWVIGQQIIQSQQPRVNGIRSRV